MSSRHLHNQVTVADASPFDPETGWTHKIIEGSGSRCCWTRVFYLLLVLERPRVQRTVLVPVRSYAVSLSSTRTHYRLRPTVQ
jgi:hypothetical protein